MPSPADGTRGGGGGLWKVIPLAIVTQENINIWPHSEARGATCFYCGEVIDPPAIYWVGAAAREPHCHYLILHPSCAIELFIRLNRDIHEVECRTGEYVTESDGIQRMRSRLLREEGVA